MLRVLLTRRWLGVFALATLFCLVAIGLGTWQYSRHVDAATAIDRVEANYDAAPVPLEQVLPGPDPDFPAEAEWTRVQASGVYAVDDRQLVRNRPHHGVYGYEVVVPLELPGGGALLVNRGWVRNAETASTLPEVPPAPSGEVQVTGWLRPSEESQGRHLPAGQLATVNLPEAEAATGRDLYAASLVLEEEVTAGGGQVARPEPLEPPSLDQGPHFAYALQWWITAPVGFVLGFVLLRREVADREGDEPAPAAPAPATGGPAGPPREPVAAGARRRSGRPKKVRIWDEEDG